jgi:hypothetical protein
MLALLAALVAILVACGDDSQPAAQLHPLAGAVEVEIDGVIYPVDEDHPLEVGNTVHTGPTGRAEILWPDGSVTRLDYLTVFSIVEIGESPSTLRGRQTAGNTYSRVVEFTEAGSRFEIDTPSAVASVQGTEYAVFIDPNEVTTVVVVDRTVLVTTPGGEATVAAGFSLTVGPPEASTGPIGDPEPTPTELLESDWIAFNSEG